jgi:hypothetical protein
MRLNKMGYEVIAFGRIEEVNEKDTKAVSEKLKKLDTVESSFTNINFETLEFEMSGRNGIDYTELEELKIWSIKMGIKMEISTGEYSDCGGGFYFNSDDQEIEEEKDEKRMAD